MIHNTNIKLMKTKPTLTDEEIRSHMDFDKLLQLHKAGAGSVSVVPKWLKIAGYTVPAVLITTVLVYSIWPSEEIVIQNQPTEQTSVAQVDSAKTEYPKVESIKEEVNSIEPSKQEAETVKNQVPNSQESKKPIVPTFTQAEPVNGFPDLYAYLNQELKYPTDALKDSLEGVVSVSFAINEQGKPTDIRITNSLGELFDLECKRVIESMPAWRAATVNGSPISTRMSIPLTFRLTKN
jgi:TonB family protein